MNDKFPFSKKKHNKIYKNRPNGFYCGILPKCPSNLCIHFHNV